MDKNHWYEHSRELQKQLDAATVELATVKRDRDDWKDRFNKLLSWKEQSSAPNRGLTTITVTDGDDLK